jgi:hypothetical protein
MRAVRLSWISTSRPRWAGSGREELFPLLLGGSAVLGQWTLTREPDDPPVIVWQADDGTAVLDDAIGDRYVELRGFTDSEIGASLDFAQAMGWHPAGTTAVFKRLSAT